MTTALTRSDLLSYMRAQRHAVEATADAAGTPQAAVVGVAILDSFELVFDTVSSSRKARNLAQDPRVAFVIGGERGEERTVQYEGVADAPTGAELERLRESYFAVFPDGRARLAWPGIIHLRVRPRWLRYSDWRGGTETIIELTADALAALA